MYIAQRKRKENIAEYILYLWQLEDLLRALQFSPEAIYSQLVQKSELDEAKKQEVFFWYMDLVNLLRKEGKEENGHLEHTLHLIADLDNLHKQLLTLPVGGFLCLGTLIAIMQWALARSEKKNAEKKETEGK